MLDKLNRNPLQQMIEMIPTNGGLILRLGLAREFFRTPLGPR